MTTNPYTERRQKVAEQIAEEKQKLSQLRDDLANVDSKVEGVAGQRQQYELLGEICVALDKLQEMDAAELFWGDELDDSIIAKQMERVHGSVGEFQEKIAEIDESKAALQKEIDDKALRIGFLEDDLLEIEEQEERAKYDFLVERDEREFPYRPMAMPWSKQGEDEKRFRKTLAAVLLLTFTFGVSIPYWELPVPDKNEPVEIPEHLVKLIKKEKPKPKPPVKKKEKKKEEKKDEAKKKETKTAQKKPKPTPAETKAARQKAESSGVLAFKDSFSDLLADDVDAKLGASARVSDKGAKSSGDTSRNLVMSQAKSSSGGINTGSLKRNVGGGAGKAIGGTGVAFSRVESAIGTEGMDERPLSDGAGPSRTDEEIQIVFDRYKAALYRIYNRELRKDPTLKGKMVLRITIEPDGSVSMAKVESTDLDSATLSSKIVARVKRFNFGPKEGVPKTTILYPIDFLPAS